MRRAAAATLTAFALTIPYSGAALAATKPKPKTVKTTATKTYAGPAATADRWGTVQVTLVVKVTTTKTGTKKTVTRRITDVRSTYEVHTDRSQFIMEQALPLLKQEVLQAQSANVQLISHATDTSEAFLQSLQGAFAQA
jgi:uncharacterized protein with FMN-binding domain